MVCALSTQGFARRGARRIALSEVRSERSFNCTRGPSLSEASAFIPNTLGSLKRKGFTAIVSLATAAASSNQIRDVDTSYELGANGHVQKPVGFEEFSHAIQSITEYGLQVNSAASPTQFKERTGHQSSTAADGNQGPEPNKVIVEGSRW